MPIDDRIKVRVGAETLKTPRSALESPRLVKVELLVVPLPLATPVSDGLRFYEAGEAKGLAGTRCSRGAEGFLDTPETDRPGSILQHFSVIFTSLIWEAAQDSNSAQGGCKTHALL